MSHLRTLQQDMDEFTEFLESLPHPPGDGVQQLTRAFKSAISTEGPTRQTRQSVQYTVPKTTQR